MATRPEGPRRAAIALALWLVGCGGEPSSREVKNARAFEALLSAVALRNEKELEQDARLVEERHDSGELLDGNYREIRKIIDKARGKDWANAEKSAYEFRSRFGDEGAYFR